MNYWKAATIGLAAAALLLLSGCQGSASSSLSHEYPKHTIDKRMTEEDLRSYVTFLKFDSEY